MNQHQIDDRLRQKICEEILAYGSSKQEGPDLTLTIDRIMTAFELCNSVKRSESEAKGE